MSCSDDTGKNIRAFVQMARDILNAQLTETYFSDPTRENADHCISVHTNRCLALYENALFFATAGYTVGVPTLEGATVMAYMTVADMCGALMFRDGKMTSHT